MPLNPFPLIEEWPKLPSYNLSPRLMDMTTPDAVKFNVMPGNAEKVSAYISSIVFEAKGRTTFELLHKEINECILRHGGIIINDSNVMMVSYEISRVIRLHIESD
jgi:hypothetical protein